MSEAASSAPYNARNKPAPIYTARPYRPVVFNRTSRTRFERNRWGELVRHLGREPTFPERILITRIISVEWELIRIDQKLDAGIILSGHDIRGRLAAENRLRLDLVAIGLGPPEAARPMDAVEYGKMLDRQRQAKPKPKPKRKPRVGAKGRAA